MLNLCGDGLITMYDAFMDQVWALEKCQLLPLGRMPKVLYQIQTSLVELQVVYDHGENVLYM